MAHLAVDWIANTCRGRATQQSGLLSEVGETAQGNKGRRAEQQAKGKRGASAKGTHPQGATRRATTRGSYQQGYYHRGYQRGNYPQGYYQRGD